MKSIRILLSAALMSDVGLAQSDAQNPSEHKHETQKPQSPKSEAQKTFDNLKALAGEWEGMVNTDPPVPEWNNGKPVKLHVTMRVTSRGNVLVHEFQEADTP